MSNPQVTATISAEDKASAVLKAVAQLADKVAKDLEKTGKTNALGNLPGQFNAATLAAEKHLSVLHRLNAAFKTLAASAASYAAYKFPHVAADAVKEYLPIEREQIAMKAAGHYSDADMDILRKQQTTLAQKYGETPEAVVHAQSEFVKRHMDAGTAAAMTEEGVKLAKAIGTTAANGARILEGMIFGTGHHVTTPEEAHRLGKRFADIAAVQNKMGAMSPADIEGGWKYAAAATTAAHISPEQVAATQMVLKREQFGGDESGVFWRQLGARVMMPTNEGRIALQAAGIKYDDYVGPGKLNAKNLNLTFAEAGLKELPTHEIAGLQKKAEAGAFKTKAVFGAAVRDAYDRAFGDTSAKDLNVIGKKAGAFFESSKGQVDGAKLWEAMLQKMSAQQILEFLGTKQGAKGVSAIQQLQTNKEYEDLLKNAGGTADRIARERMDGLAAAVDRLTASYDDAKNQFVEANKPVLTGLANLGTKLTGWLSSLDGAQKQTTTYAAALASVIGGAWGLKSALDLSKKVLESITGKPATPGVPLAPAAVPGAPAGAAPTAGGSALGAVLPASLGVAAGAVAAGAIHEAMWGLKSLGLIDSTVRPHGPGHWEEARQGRSTYRKWVPDSLFERYDNQNPKNESFLKAAYERLTYTDPFAHRRASEMLGAPTLAGDRAAAALERMQKPEPSLYGGFGANNGQFRLPAAEPSSGAASDKGNLSALLSAVNAINSKPVDVNVAGQVSGQAEVHSSIQIELTGADKVARQAASMVKIPLDGNLNKNGQQQQR
ncbi:hypothetical protein M2323_002737 [Rhodoblastus acidophilus]|uniref:phage tail tape measure protein n=1 Tax=Rhodoblastus acidophilus TaxID=1074 RepID=UPI0022248D19|nr:phage tail tape measure protein [Rhodoblastus acidophilus]MCW2284909.1 hypothetical protein [Rhodoblastus acidophilus]MCW2333801.1 hypothetical protein [Rhodoblastus acidophilus]